MNNKINFSRFFKFANIFSLFAVIISVLFLFFKGLNYGVDFKGGTLLEIRIENTNIQIQEIRTSLKIPELGDVNVKEFGKKGDFLIKFEKNFNENDKFITDLKNVISKKIGSAVNFRRVESVGPKVSSELLKQGLTAIVLALGAMLFYIWIRFEWQFSLGSIIALIHDVLITLGIFSILSFEVNLSIVAAVLTIVGYSMNDTVVIFDRIRENLLKYSPDAVIIVVSNPMDTMTYLVNKSFDIPKNRIIGMGGILDSSRFKTYISKFTNYSQHDIDAMVIGGHGDTTMIPLTSLAKCKDELLSKIASKNELSRIASETMVGGATLTKLLGTSAWYAPGASVSYLVNAIINDTKEVLPCSVYLTGEYNVEDICIGVPSIIGRNGFEEVVEFDLDQKELEMFNNSVKAVKQTNLTLDGLI